MKIELNKVYFCETLEDAQSFLQECDEQDICWASGHRTPGYTTYYRDGGIGYRVRNNELGKPCISSGSLECFRDSFPEYEIVTYTKIQLSGEELAAIDTAWKDLMKIK